MSKRLVVFLFFVVGSLGQAFDRETITALPAKSNLKALHEYARNIALANQSHTAHFFSQILTTDHWKPDLVVATNNIDVENWHNDRCGEVNRNLSRAESYFKKFKFLALRLEKLLAQDNYGVKTHEEISVIYEEMKAVQALILQAYPETYDTWEVRLSAHWELPKDRIFYRRDYGVLFYLAAATTPHFHWENTDVKRKIPDEIKFTSSKLNYITGRIKTVPVVYCSSNFVLHAFLLVAGDNMNTLKVHLTTF